MGPAMRALLSDHGLRYDPAYPDPQPAPGEALIRMRLAGICNTDLELVRGYMSFRGVLGHEFVGEVVQASDPAWLGRRVVGDINAACRSQTCDACGAGRYTHCPNRTTLGIAGRDGAFADYLTLPLVNLYAVPDNVSDEMAVFTEPLAAACEILAQIKIAPTDRVYVLGDGKLGLLVAAVLRLTGADLTLVGRNRNKLAIAEGWGVQVRLTEEPLPAQMADVVVECTGSPQGFEFARRLRAPARHPGAEEHLSWRVEPGYERVGGGRDHADRFTLWAVRPGAAPAGVGPGRSPAAYCRDIYAGPG